MQATTAPERKLRPWRRPVILALIVAAALTGVALVTYDRICNPGRPGPAGPGPPPHLILRP